VRVNHFKELELLVPASPPRAGDPFERTWISRPGFAAPCVWITRKKLNFSSRLRRSRCEAGLRPAGKFLKMGLGYAPGAGLWPSLLRAEPGPRAQPTWMSGRLTGRAEPCLTSRAAKPWWEIQVLSSDSCRIEQRSRDEKFKFFRVIHAASSGEAVARNPNSFEWFMPHRAAEPQRNPNSFE